MRRKPDEIDMHCSDWAIQRRKILGIILPEMLEPRERLGKLRSTLGAVKTDAEGASHGKPNQNFPEVYLGMALVVHRAFTSMRGEWREVMHAHYVFREVPPKLKCAELGITQGQYFDRLEKLKIYLESWLMASGQRSA